MLRLNVFLIVLILFVNEVLAQREGSQIQNFKEGIVKGRIFDNETQQPLSKASCTLIRLKDSSVAGGGLSDNLGNVLIEKVTGGRYTLKINYVGYQTYYVDDIFINPKNPVLDFGEIKLLQTSEMLDEVKVTAERDVIQFSAGKRIINVDQDIASKGGNALDVLKNAPSVNVDVDGNVSLRGSGNINILINGKPSTIMGGGSAVLEQLPANIIDHIEIITNPSAKYEAEGSTGILNIVLKQEKDPGFNGIVSMNVGSYDRYTASVNMNYKLDGFNLFGSYDFNSFRGGMNGNTSRITFTGDSTSSLIQSMERRRGHQMHNLKAGVEMNIDKDQSIILTGVYRPRTVDFGGFTFSQQTFGQNPFIDSTKRYSQEEGDSPNFDLSMNYKNNFGKEHNLSLDVFYSKSDDNEFTTYDQFNYDMLNKDLFEKSDNIEKDNSIVIQSDYVNKLDETFKLESGIRFSSKTMDNKYSYFDKQNDTWILNNNKMNNFIYDENIFAAYTIVSTDFDPLFFQVGLRAENSNINGDNTVMQKVNQQSYFDFFPSANVTYKFSKLLEIQGNYSRRINRPRGHSLNPFVDYSDVYTIRYGNPDLKPEYSNLFEVGTIHNIAGIAFNPAIFYRTTENVMERYQELLEGGVIGSTFKNMAKSESYGLEFNANGPIFKWLRLNGDISYYKYRIEGVDSSRKISEDYTWSSRLSFNMFLSKSLNLQLSGYYTAPTVTSQGTRSEMASVDLGARYDVTDELTVTMRASDIFDTQKFSNVSNGPGFTFNFDMKRQSQAIFLGFQYKINQGIKQRERKTRDDNNTDFEDF